MTVVESIGEDDDEEEDDERDFDRSERESIGEDDDEDMVSVKALVMVTVMMMNLGGDNRDDDDDDDLGRAFSAGKDAFLMKMLNSWKTNVFGQFSLNLPKIDVLAKMSFFAFWDNVFFRKVQKRNFTQKSGKSTKRKNRFSHFFSL